VPPTPVAIRGFAVNNGVYAPKVIACGSTAILMFATGPSDNGIYAASLDCTQPWVGWTISTRLTQYKAPGVPALKVAYDLCPVINDATSWAFVCQTVAGDSSRHITVFQCAVSTLTVIQQANIESGNTVWTGDGFPDISAFAIRADNANGECAVAVSWQTGGTPRLTVQIQLWTAIGTNYGNRGQRLHGARAAP
jgi:hypothetical protein